MWFRHDLRITDNPALNEACRLGEIIPIYIQDNYNHQNKQIGSASKWWLHQSLISLNNDLDGGLITFTGDPKKIIPKLVNESGIKSHSWLNWQIPILTEGDHTNARIININVKKINDYLDDGGVAVIPGFQGISKIGDITSIGRGGSSSGGISAALIRKTTSFHFSATCESVKSAERLSRRNLPSCVLASWHLMQWDLMNCCASLPNGSAAFADRKTTTNTTKLRTILVSIMAGSISLISHRPRHC